jgi:type IV fimbrial biogenesis protein FimT
MNRGANPPPRRSVGGRRPPAGFTLVEMVITLLILGILVAVGLPTFSDATLGSRLSSTANNLVVSFYLARSEAIKRNTIVRVCPSTDGNSCASAASWQTGWIIMAPYASGTWCAAERPTWASRSALSVYLPPAGRR